MAGGESDPGGTGVGVDVGSTLAHEVGHPEEALGERRGGGGEGGERVVRFVGRELVAEPLKREAGALGDAHDVPFVGDGVAEGVDAAVGVVCGLIEMDEDDAGGAEGVAGDAGFDDAVADGGTGLVASASGDGGAWFESSG